jgi:hypothetical protein
LHCDCIAIVLRLHFDCIAIALGSHCVVIAQGINACSPSALNPRSLIPCFFLSLPISNILPIISQHNTPTHQRLQKWVHEQVKGTVGGGSVANLIASSIVSPIYVVVTNPLSRLEVIMQTSSIAGKRIGVMEAIGEMAKDMTQFGVKGIFRGQGIGIFKAIISLSLFHEGRMFLGRETKEWNVNNGYVYKAPETKA